MGSAIEQEYQPSRQAPVDTTTYRTSLCEVPSHVEETFGQNDDGWTQAGDGSEEWRRKHPHGGWRYSPNGRPFEWKDLEDLRQKTSWEALVEESERRGESRWYPFADRTEWEVAEFLIQASLPKHKIDQFLKLPYVRRHHSSY